MNRHLYSFFFTLAVPLILLRLWLRSLRTPAYRQRIGERFGHANLPDRFSSQRPTLWIHAVSVGETVAAAPLIRALLSERDQLQIIVTTMTPTGSARVRTLFADAVLHSYLPYDLPFAINRFLRKLSPSQLIIMETELWPNLIHCCADRGVKIVLANARLSEKSAKGYGRLASMTRSMLERIDHIAAQDDADANRLIALGADPQRLSITGSLKFHVNLEEAILPDSPVFQSVEKSGRSVVIAASTRDGEEQRLLPAIEEVLQHNPNTLFIIVPRHPERFETVASLCVEHGLRIQRRSDNLPVDAHTQVLIGDSMGEMLAYYGLADIAFVGGSLVDTGCQNVLEPAALGLPVVVGPSQFNFAAICKQLEEAGGLHTIADSAALAMHLNELIEDTDRRRARGMAGRILVEDNQQALPRLLEIIGRHTPVP